MKVFLLLLATSILGWQYLTVTTTLKSRIQERTNQIDYVINELERLYPKTPVPLKHHDPYTLLIAVLLSAQCTDERVNQITPILFEKADTPSKMIQLPVETIKQIIRKSSLTVTESLTLTVTHCMTPVYPSNYTSACIILVHTLY